MTPIPSFTYSCTCCLQKPDWRSCWNRLKVRCGSKDITENLILPFLRCLCPWSCPCFHWWALYACAAGRSTSPWSPCTPLLSVASSLWNLLKLEVGLEKVRKQKASKCKRNIINYKVKLQAYLHEWGCPHEEDLAAGGGKNGCRRWKLFSHYRHFCCCNSFYGLIGWEGFYVQIMKASEDISLSL